MNPELPPLPPVPPPPAKKTNGLAIAALVCGLLAICIPLLGFVACGLGIGALIQLSSAPDQKGKGFAIFGIVSPIFMIGLLALIAIPNFIKFQKKAKQAVCRGALKQVAIAEKELYSQERRFSDSFDELHADIAQPAYYAIVLSEDHILTGGKNAPDDATVRAALEHHPVGVRGECPNCRFTALCIGNLDSDGDLDVWSISDSSSDPVHEEED